MMPMAIMEHYQSEWGKVDMKYCKPYSPLCTYVQWTGHNHEEVEAFLGASKVEYDSKLELYYAPSLLAKNHIPKGYYIVDYGRHMGGKKMIHPNMFPKMFKEVTHD